MDEIVTDKQRAQAREDFENHLRFAFARIEHHVDDEEDTPEVHISVNIKTFLNIVNECKE